VAEVVETGDDGWVAELDYFVTDRARQMVNRQGRFLLQPTVEGVAFIRAY
jgi:hypothetical protein